MGMSGFRIEHTHEASQSPSAIKLFQSITKNKERGKRGKSPCTCLLLVFLWIEWKTNEMIHIVQGIDKQYERKQVENRIRSICIFPNWPENSFNKYPDKTKLLVHLPWLLILLTISVFWQGIFSGFTCSWSSSCLLVLFSTLLNFMGPLLSLPESGVQILVLLYPCLYPFRLQLELQHVSPVSINGTPTRS